MNKYHNHIAIIGAGISGLALGCILQEARIPVVIFEQSNEVSNYGAGISISPNGIKILKNLKIYKDVLEQSSNPKNRKTWSATAWNGSTSCRRSYSDSLNIFGGCLQFGAAKFNWP